MLTVMKISQDLTLNVCFNLWLRECLYCVDIAEADHRRAFTFKWFMMSSEEVGKRRGGGVVISGAQTQRELWPYGWGLLKHKSYLQVALDSL